MPLNDNEMFGDSDLMTIANEFCRGHELLAANVRLELRRRGVVDEEQLDLLCDRVMVIASAIARERKLAAMTAQGNA